MQKNESGALPNIQKEINSKQIKNLKCKICNHNIPIRTRQEALWRSVLVKVFRPVSLAKAKIRRKERKEGT